MSVIRHSSLPKLSVSSGGCACFESAGGSSPAAERGTNMDEVFRKAYNGDAEALESLSKADREAVEWAIETLRGYAAGDAVITDPESLKVRTSIIDHTGTEDARIPSRCLSFDLKTGQMRNYMEQMAAYALGNMEAMFADHWTCVLVFCDQRKTVTHEFTFEDAKRIVEDVVAGVLDVNKQPTACDYCGWCARRNTCPAVVRPVADTQLIVEEGQLSLEVIKRDLLANPDRLGKFLRAANVFKKELWDFAKDEAKRKLEAGEEVPGWKLQASKGSETFDTLSIIEAAVTTDATMTDVVELMGGEVSGKKFRDWTSARGYTPSETEAKIGTGITKLVEIKAKKK